MTEFEKFFARAGVKAARGGGVLTHHELQRLVLQLVYENCCEPSRRLNLSASPLTSTDAVCDGMGV